MRSCAMGRGAAMIKKSAFELLVVSMLVGVLVWAGQPISTLAHDETNAGACLHANFFIDPMRAVRSNSSSCSSIAYGWTSSNHESNTKHNDHISAIGNLPEPEWPREVFSIAYGRTSSYNDHIFTVDDPLQWLCIVPGSPRDVFFFFFRPLPPSPTPPIPDLHRIRCSTYNHLYHEYSKRRSKTGDTRIDSDDANTDATPERKPEHKRKPVDDPPTNPVSSISSEQGRASKEDGHDAVKAFARRKRVPGVYCFKNSGVECYNVDNLNIFISMQAR
jgi:hypothetical protein